MKLRFLAPLFLLAPALVTGQDKETIIVPRPYYDDVKQYLSLTDSQIVSLQAIMDSRNRAIQDIYTQISQKYDALYQLLNSDAATAAQLGQFLIDIRSLQKQLPQSDEPYKSQALNVLTLDQKAKLPKLSEAMQLQATASEAAMLMLIDYPSYLGHFDILPALGTPSGISATGPGAPAINFAPRLQAPPPKR